MTPKEFYDKVVYMRHCQRNYYAARRKKDAEKQRYYLGLSIPIEMRLTRKLSACRKLWIVTKAPHKGAFVFRISIVARNLKKR